MIGTVLPGVSTSFILINMNVYKSFMEVFTKFLSNPGQNIVLGLSSIAGILGCCDSDAADCSEGA